MKILIAVLPQHMRWESTTCPLSEHILIQANIKISKSACQVVWSFPNLGFEDTSLSSTRHTKHLMPPSRIVMLLHLRCHYCGAPQHRYTPKNKRWQWKIPILTIGHTSSNDGWSIAMLVFRKSISPKPSCCELKGGKFSSSMPANKLSHSDLSIAFHRQNLSVLPCIWVFSFHKTGHQTMVSMARWAMGAIL